MLVEYFSNMAKVGICKFKPCKTQTKYGGKNTSTCIIVKLLRTEGKEETLKVARQEARWVLGAFTSPAMSFKEGGISQLRQPQPRQWWVSSVRDLLSYSYLLPSIQTGISYQNPSKPFHNVDTLNIPCSTLCCLLLSWIGILGTGGWAWLVGGF